MEPFTTIETTRLRLRHFQDTDCALFMAYRNDPEVARYQSWEGITAAEARAFIQEMKEIQPWVPGEYFQIAIELKETGLLVGDCAMRTSARLKSALPLLAPTRDVVSPQKLSRVS